MKSRGKIHICLMCSRGCLTMEQGMWVSFVKKYQYVKLCDKHRVSCGKTSLSHIKRRFVGWVGKKVLKMISGPSYNVLGFVALIGV